jgi:hypothetical protein
MTAPRMVSKLWRQHRTTKLGALSYSWTSACPSRTGSRQLAKLELWKKAEASALAAAPAPASIVALTGLASSAATGRNVFASGVDLFMTKPVKFKEIGKLLDERMKEWGLTKTRNLDFEGDSCAGHYNFIPIIVVDSPLYWELSASYDSAIGPSLSIILVHSQSGDLGSRNAR